MPADPIGPQGGDAEDEAAARREALPGGKCRAHRPTGGGGAGDPTQTWGLGCIVC